VVRCHTTFGVTPGKLTLPSRVRVYGAAPSAASHLVAYTNTEMFLIGPAGMACSGIVAADGGSQITVWSIGKAAPARHSAGEGLTLTLDPACASCRADDACPFFRSFAAGLGFPCTSGVSAGERVDRLSSQVVYFTDAPGLAGDGWPSGGYFPADGLAGIRGSATSGTVFRTTCTLPMAKSAVCAISLLNVLRSYATPSAKGARRP
jgi:hypothetical protein